MHSDVQQPSCSLTELKLVSQIGGVDGTEGPLGEDHIPKTAMCQLTNLSFKEEWDILL